MYKSGEVSTFSQEFTNNVLEMNNMKKPLILCILDGFGIAENEGNAIAAAKTPNLDKIFAENPTTAIGASGMDVGLPDGQMGNSEVGHTNIGAGRIEIGRAHV